MEKKKLLFVYYKLFKPGGINRVLVNLVNELTKEYNITVLVLMAKHDSFYSLDSRIKVVFIDSFAHWAFAKVNVSIDKYMRWLPKRVQIKNYFYDFGAYRTLGKWLKKNHSEYEIIVSCMYKLSAQLASNPTYASKTIAWEHTDHTMGGFVFNNLKKKYFKNLKGIVAINNSAVQYYINLNSKTYLIPNIIGEPFESLSIANSKENFITYVGRLDKDKNVGELIELFSQVNAKDWIFQIIGNGPELINLENQVVSLGLKNQVVFFGEKNSNEISELLSQSKIFAFTSKKEAFALVLVEAMFAGNTLISYDCKFGPADIISEKNGFLIPMHDKVQFQEKLQFLIDNPEVLKELNQSSFNESKKWRKEERLKQWKSIL
jgi:GalNAc-alpha-(1->4)-GalNAc-alpha-(1->3)-diNAcBac-PP-undecaprenol alpha-1,4-N-acetyl-D-galactosaminyltransferase